VSWASMAPLGIHRSKSEVISNTVRGGV